MRIFVGNVLMAYHFRPPPSKLNQWELFLSPPLSQKEHSSVQYIACISVQNNWKSFNIFSKSCKIEHQFASKHPPYYQSREDTSRPLPKMTIHLSHPPPPHLPSHYIPQRNNGCAPGISPTFIVIYLNAIHDLSHPPPYIWTVSVDVKTYKYLPESEELLVYSL